MIAHAVAAEKGAVQVSESHRPYHRLPVPMMNILSGMAPTLTTASQNS